MKMPLMEGLITVSSVKEVKKAKIKVIEIHVGKEKTGKRFVSHFKVIVTDVGG